MIRRTGLVGLILLCAAPAPARERSSLMQQASAAASADAEDGVDLGAVLRRLHAEGRSGTGPSPTGTARVTRAEWRSLLDQARREAGAQAAGSDTRALAMLHRAYARRTDLDEAAVAPVRALVLAHLGRDEAVTEFGGGAQAWLDQGRPKPLAGVAPEILARVNAEILASPQAGRLAGDALRARIRRAELWLGADPRAAGASLVALASEPALTEPALEDLLDGDLWAASATAR